MLCKYIFYILNVKINFLLQYYYYREEERNKDIILQDVGQSNQFWECPALVILPQVFKVKHLVMETSFTNICGGEKAYCDEDVTFGINQFIKLNLC